MTTVPETEANARTVLEIFEHFKATAGHALPASSFAAIAANADIPMSDIASGMTYATEHKWVEKMDTGSFKLTDLGFAEMSN